MCALLRSALHTLVLCALARIHTESNSPEPMLCRYPSPIVGGIPCVYHFHDMGITLDVSCCLPVSSLTQIDVQCCTCLIVSTHTFEALNGGTAPAQNTAVGPCLATFRSTMPLGDCVQFPLADYQTEQEIEDRKSRSMKDYCNFLKHNADARRAHHGGKGVAARRRTNGAISYEARISKHNVGVSVLQTVLVSWTSEFVRCTVKVLLHPPKAHTQEVLLHMHSQLLASFSASAGESGILTAGLICLAPGL